MKRLLHITAVLSFFLVVPLRAIPEVHLDCPKLGETPLVLSVDGVALQGCLPFSPASTWVQPDPSQRVQIAYTLGTGPGYSITAIPFGMVAPNEIFPRIDASSREDNLREILRQARQAQGAQVQTGPTAQLFGRTVSSWVSTLNLPRTTTSAQSTRVTEWLLVAGQRLWIFRATQPISIFGAASSTGLTLSSPNLDAPSPSAAAFNRQRTSTATQPPKSSLSDDPSNNLPSPTWWSGICDKDNYYGAYPLVASYRNVPSCGPLPGLGYPDVLVYFYEGAFPALEWECVELVLRWMYQAYGVPPYAANGSGIVYNYAGDRMEKINNGIPGKAPVPGDVISYCPYCTYGHVSVVISSTVNDSGNGSITVMEQNWTWGGQTILPVYGWKVIGDAGWVYGWLHSKIIPDPTPTPLPTCVPTPTAAAATPTVLSTPLPYQMYAPSIFNGDLEPCS